MKYSELSSKKRAGPNWLKFAAASLLAVAALAGCGGGSDGAEGPQGKEGPISTVPGPAGADKTIGTVDAKQLSAADLKNRALGGKILSVDTSGEQPVVNFQVVMKATNEGVAGLRTFALHIAQQKPAVDGSASYWLNYIADGMPASSIPANVKRNTTTPIPPTNPAADATTLFNADGTVLAQGYTVADGGDGTYAVTFGAKIKTNTKVVYDASLIHRVVVGVRSVAVPGVVGKTEGAYAGPVDPLTNAVYAQFTNTNGANLHYDFTPAASGPGAMLVDSAGKQMFARDNVTIAACNQCHQKLEYGFPRGNNTSGHFGSRTDTKTCVMCHTPQNTAGKGDFTTFIHKLHMGEELKKTELEFWSTTGTYNEIKYPQDIRNCTQCHQGAVVDSQINPSAKACLSCHNAVNPALGAAGGHAGGGVRTDDKLCALCHDAADINVNHVAVIPPDPNNAYTTTGGSNYTNASYLAAAGVVPVGATKITYVVSGVKRETTGNPSITFKFQKSVNGATPEDVVFNTYSATGKTELMDGFVGSPSVYFAFGVEQDGIKKPADYNASASTYIKNVWRADVKDAKGVALKAAEVGTMTGPVAGYYTITLTGVSVPATATMLTGGVGYTYALGTTQPLTQIDLPAYPYTANASTVNAGVGGVGGLSVPAPNVWKVATGFTGRRLIVDNAKCNSCHTQLGVKPTFHAGQRNDAQTCTFCHNVNKTNNGWPVNINYDVHALHNGNSGQRVNKFSWEASAGAKFWEVGYPGQLKNCEGCHIAGTYDYSASGSANAVPNMLMTTGVSGTTDTPATVNVITTGSEAVPGTYYSPFVLPSTTYGATFAFNANTGATTPAADTTLVLSPISAACSGCHDSGIAKEHMQSNGGTVFGLRSDAKVKTETCLVCHGTANNAGFNETVPAIKAVHRWW